MQIYTVTHPQAVHAIVAAHYREQWGHWASRRYAEKHGVHMDLYILACILQAYENMEGKQNG